MTEPTEQTEQFPNTATIRIRAYEDGPMIDRAYRWRVEEVGHGLRAVGEFLRGDGRWTELKNPDRLAALLALSPRQPT